MTSDPAPTVRRGGAALVTAGALRDRAGELGTDLPACESWVMSGVESIAALPGLQPPNADNKARRESQQSTR